MVEWTYFITWRRGRRREDFFRQGRPVAEWPDAVSGRRCCTDTPGRSVGFFNWKLIPCHFNESRWQYLASSDAVSDVFWTRLHNAVAQLPSWFDVIAFNYLIPKHLISAFVKFSVLRYHVEQVTVCLAVSSTDLSRNDRCWSSWRNRTGSGERMTTITYATGRKIMQMMPPFCFGQCSLLCMTLIASCVLQLGAFFLF
jgi:hypothetical protein